MKQLSEYSFADLWAMRKYFHEHDRHNPDADNVWHEIHRRLNNTNFKPVAESKINIEGNVQTKIKTS